MAFVEEGLHARVKRKLESITLGSLGYNPNNQKEISDFSSELLKDKGLNDLLKYCASEDYRSVSDGRPLDLELAKVGETSYLLGFYFPGAGPSSNAPLPQWGFYRVLSHTPGSRIGDYFEILTPDTIGKDLAPYTTKAELERKVKEFVATVGQKIQ